MLKRFIASCLLVVVIMTSSVAPALARPAVVPISTNDSRLEGAFGCLKIGDNLHYAQLMLFPLAGLFSQITHVSFGGNPELEDHLDLSILVGSEGNITFVSPIERIVMRLPKSDSGESTNTTGDGLVITGYNPNTKLLFATASVLMQKYSSGSTTAIANLIHVFYLLNLVPKISPVVLEGSSFTQPVVECKPFEDYEKDLALAAITAKVYREMDKSARRVSGRLEPEGDQSILAAIATIVAGGAAALGKAGVDIVRGAVEWVAHELEHGI